MAFYVKNNVDILGSETDMKKLIRKFRESKTKSIVIKLMTASFDCPVVFVVFVFLRSVILSLVQLLLV